MWFEKEVLSPRILSSLIWHLILQLAFVQLFLFTYQVILWYPGIGIQTWLSRLISGSSIVYHFFLSVLSVLFAILHTQHYSVEQKIPKTRMQALWSFLHPQRLLHLAVLSLFGGLMVLCYTQFLGGEFANVQEECVEDCSTSGVNGPHIFLLLYGVYAGAVYSLKYFKHGWYLVQFPIIQQMKFLTVKSRTWEILNDSVCQVLKSLHWFYLIYCIFGSYLKHWSAVMVGIQNSSNSQFNEIFNLSLLIITLVCGTMLYFTWTLFFCLFNVFVTDRHEFVMETTLESAREKVLPKALCHTNRDILKYLAVLDLKGLAQSSPSRRAYLFSISQPGGHPYQWEAVSSICIAALEEFLCQLNDLSTAAITSAAKQPVMYTPVTATPVSTSRQRSLLTGSFSYASPNLNATLSEIPFSPYSPIVKPATITDSIGVTSYLLTSIKKIQEALWKRPIVCYFLNELPDAKARSLFNSCQPIIWIIEALSFVVSASYKEDRYGVVQQSFPKILCLLIDLKLTEEKVQLGTMSVKQHGKENSLQQKETLFRHSLKSALNSALYRIVITFKNHISGLHVPEEYCRHIRRYMDFKE